jgi:hypothetical protein
MAFDPLLADAVNRVRALVADRTSTRFQDDEIAAQLTLNGFVGNPFSSSVSRQELPEIEAAIAILQSEATGSSVEDTIKQGSVTRTKKGGSGDYSKILAALIARRNRVLGLTSGDTGPVVVDAYPDCCASVYPCR